MAIFEREYTVNIENVGSSNLITNRGLLSILEDIACKHSDTVGFGINDIPVTHYTWVLLFWKVCILKRVSYGTTLKVRTWAKNVNKFYTYRDFEVLDEDNNCICIATSKWSLINTEKESISRITDDIIQKYSPDNRSVFDELEVNRLTDPANYISKYVYKVQRRDIDVNKHMHNLNYLSLAYEALPDEIYFSTEFNNIEIMYKKAIKLGDTVKCLYSNTEDVHFITIKSEDENSIHAIIKLY